MLVNLKKPTNELPPRRSSYSGFTLIEVMLAISVLAVMITLSYSSIESIIRSKKAVEDDQEIERLELVFIRRLSRELQLADHRSRRLPSPDNLKKIPSRSEIMLGNQGSLGNGNPGDSITFMAISAGQTFLEDKLANTGVVQISYSLKEDPEREKIEDYPVYSLIREEIPNKRPYEKAYKEAVRFPLLDFAEGLKIEYFDLEDGKWLREWGDPDHRYLPAMVRFSLFVRSPAGKKKVIKGTVPLRVK